MGLEKTTGHVCDLPPEVDSLLLRIPGKGCTKHLRRWFRTLCLVSRSNENAIALFHSKNAIRMERDRHLNTYYWIIHPFSKFRTVWEFIMCFVFLVSMLIIPYTVTFNPSETSLSSPWVLFELALDVMCALDIVMNFNSGIFDTKLQDIILNPAIITRRYVYSYFLFDFCSTMPFETIFGNLFPSAKEVPAFSLISLTNLLKIARMKTLMTYLGRTFQLFKMGHLFIIVTRTIIFFLVFIHWMACLCFLVVSVMKIASPGGENDNKSWVSTADIWNESGTMQYAHAVFRAVLESNHVNYAHGTPKTAADMLVTCLMGILGTIIFIYVVSITLQIIYITNNVEFKYEEDTNQLKEFMSQRQLPNSFQMRLIELNEFKFRRSFFREKNILNSLPGQLQQEILIHSCRHLVENVSFFNNLSSTMLVRLVMVLKSEIYLKKQEIIKINTRGDCMYFLASGTIAVYSASGKEVCHMQDGSHFGEMALLNPDRQRTASVVALEISEVYRLDRRDFVLIVAQFPDMVDQLKQIAAERQEQMQRIDV